MKSRKMICADRFYPYDSDECKQQLNDLFAAAEGVSIPKSVKAAIVPHAGWVFSGELAALGFEAIARSRPSVETFVVFGAVHSCMLSSPAVYPEGIWDTPIGQIEVDKDLAKELLEQLPELISDPSAHQYEHSIEVNTPFIKYKFPQAKILPILMPHTCDVLKFSEKIAAVLQNYNPQGIVCVASTDLTHYGSDYGFAPKGSGVEDWKWAKQVNDKSLIEAILSLESEKTLNTAVKNLSACGPAAIAAVITAAKKLGANQAKLLSHKHSSEIMQEKFARTSANSVGYAAIIFTE